MHWADQYLHVQNLVNANLRKSLDITLNGQTFAHSTFRKCKSLDITRIDKYLRIQSLVNVNLLASH
uniref:Uncharacterized protein n=1 Tax=viral metagenome TaxID=1070528 RepID=A0A6C0C706_9ZZZZ